jgi:hypothetical protein
MSSKQEIAVANLRIPHYSLSTLDLQALPKPAPFPFVHLGATVSKKTDYRNANVSCQTKAELGDNKYCPERHCRWIKTGFKKKRRPVLHTPQF